MKISAGIANREVTLENADQIKNGMEREVRSVLSKLRELKSLTDTTFYNQLHLAMTLRKQRNAPGLASLKKELNEALRKHHQKMESEYKEEK